VSNLGRLFSYLAIEDLANHQHAVDEERRAMYRRADAPPLPPRPRPAARTGLRLPSLLWRRGAQPAGE
jgi:hypothetical protein